MDGAGQMPVAFRSSDTDTALALHGHTADEEDEFVSQDEATDTSFSDVSMGVEPAFYHDIDQGGLSISSHSQQVYSTIINHVVHADTSTMTSTDTTPNRGVKNDLCYTPDETSARHGEKIITIPASKSKLELLRNDKMLTSVQRRFPDMAITFEVNSGYLGLRGVDTEVGVVKNAIEAALSKYKSLHHMWSPRMAKALQQIPDAEDFIRSACMDHDSDGIVQFTPEGFEVCSDEEERAQAMMAAGMSAVRQWDITLKGDTSGAESLPAWQELKSKVQGRHQGRILMMEDQTHLSIVGVGPVDDDVTLLQDFIEQRRYLEVKMDRAEYELLGLFLKDPEVNGSTLPAVEITFTEDTSQLVVHGCRNYVQYAEKYIKRFQAMVIREEREFSQPSMREFLESPDWTEKHRPQIEKRVKCKIMEPRVAPSPHSGRRHTPMSRSAPDLRRLNTEQDLQYTRLGPTPECEEEGAVGGAFRTSCNLQQDDDDVPSAEPVYSPSELYGHLPHSSSHASLPGLWTRRSTLSSEQQHYVPSNPRISLRPMSEVTEVEEDVLVNSTNAQLNLELGQISQALLKSGGSTLQRECRTNYPSGISRGDVAVTGIGIPGKWSQMLGRKPLQCKKLFHCRLPPTKNIEEMKSAVAEAVRKCLEKAETLRLASIAFPALGTGNLRYTPDIVAQVMYDAVLDYGRQHPRTLVLSVVILLHRKAEDAHIRQAFKAEDEKYKQLLRDSLQFSQDETMPMSVVHSRAAKVEAYNHFTRASSRVRVTILAYRQPAVDEAEQELLDCYNKNVVSFSTNVSVADFWAEPNIAAVKQMCAALKVDLTVNYGLRQVSFRGLHHNYVNIVRTMQNTMKHDEQTLRQKRDTALLAEQVQWSVVEITKDGEHLLRYDVENNQRIEMAYREDKLYATVKVDSDVATKSYIVDFATFEEKSYDQGDAEPLRVIRQEKIQVTKEDGEVPTSHGWSALNGQELDVIPLRAGSKEYTAVVDSLNKAPVDVVKIERVQNLGLHKQYLAMKREIGSSVPSGCQHERDILWHGTSLESADGIIKHGFHRTYCYPDENNFGQGIYFTSSTESINEDEFAVPSSSGERHVFRCKVLIGQYTQGDQPMRFPPVIQSANSSRRYNSTVDDPKDPKIFVIYSHFQAYPQYRIVFKKK